jgi:hypothetical protein
MDDAMRVRFRLTVVAACLVVGGTFSACDQRGNPPPSVAAGGIGASEAIELYLNLMKLTLTDLAYEKDPKVRSRLAGEAWGEFPSRAYTMIGLPRLDNLQFVMEDTLARGIPGDFIEAGAWRGGATIFMRAVLKAHGVGDRTVWVADSFEGLPPPNPEQFPEDEGSELHTWEELAISLEVVKSNFEHIGLLDDQVRFLKGWFKDTLPNAPIEKLAVLRVDADLYESTTQALEYLYPKLSPGGYVIVDDYGILPPCKAATVDFRKRYGITSELKKIDWTGVYWMKE